MEALKSILTATLFCYVFVMAVVGDWDSQTLFYDWTISMSQRQVLGVKKQVILVNNQFPGPILNATTNDIVNINIHNNLTDPFLLTWNGVQLRRNSWQDGVQGTNCPIMPGQSWTYSFEIKDQIGSFFYFPSILLHKAAGGYGAIRVNNRTAVPLPFPTPDGDFDVLIGDWFNSDYKYLRSLLDEGDNLPAPDGILINGLGPYQSVFRFETGATYRLRISNVGLKTSLNFRIQDHLLLLVETEGSYTRKQYLSSLDVHVGQSYSVLVTAKNQSGDKSFYMVASSRFTSKELFGIGIVRYPDSKSNPSGSLPSGPPLYDYIYSITQARTIRWDLAVGAARVDPQGSYRYGSIKESGTLILQSGVMFDGNRVRYTINGMSYVNPDTPLSLADLLHVKNVYQTGLIPEKPIGNLVPGLGTPVIDVIHRSFYHIVFENSLSKLQTWHLDGYNLFVVGMGFGKWEESSRKTYNLIDAVPRSTVQVCPYSWTATLVMLDNPGIWNLRSQDAESWYLGQELYIRVKDFSVAKPNPSIPGKDEALPPPANVILCGRAYLENEASSHEKVED
ncbi:hypothetical protein K2173_007556 [Erythroxylum novogranatense]|uniref:Uncharacterized protein n=1 Tax=Erythroxylum novogranatense TaxID=1862640 RepID=A0AAV8T6I5_9ROSI|nr:hypothetical protein K2173_007556 [Erythroxylum novogranatense]